MKINGMNVHGLKSAVGNYNRMLNVIGTGYIMFDTRDGEVFAQDTNFTRNLSIHVVGYPPSFFGSKATMESVKAEIAWLTSAERKQQLAQQAKEKEAVAMEYIKAAECKEAEIASSWLVEG